MLLDGIPPSTRKSGSARAAEEEFEAIRLRDFPTPPSRLRSFFVSLDEASAKEQAQYWGWSGRTLVRCYLVLPGANYHYADVRDFEAAARGHSVTHHATSYWGDYDPEKVPPGVTEVGADGSLYFPDWRRFPQLDVDALARWQLSRNA